MLWHFTWLSVMTRELRRAGLTVPLERKRELYAICSEYDVVIIEDDPYYYLQFGVRGELLDSV